MTEKAKDLVLLTALKSHPAYKRLQELWLEDISEIETKRDLSAARGQESAWRYWAGQEKGAKRLMVRLDIEIERLKEEGADPSNAPSEIIEKLLSEARGEPQ